MRRVKRYPLPHDGKWNWSAQNEGGDISACQMAPPKKLLESVWEERAVWGTTQSQTQKGHDS